MLKTSFQRIFWPSSLGGKLEENYRTILPKGTFEIMWSYFKMEKLKPQIVKLLTQDYKVHPWQKPRSPGSGPAPKLKLP